MKSPPDVVGIVGTTVSQSPILKDSSTTNSKVMNKAFSMQCFTNEICLSWGNCRWDWEEWLVEY